MTNIAQMVNVLQAMILTTKDKMVLTPTYHAFAMYIPFQDATSLPATLEGNPVYKVDKYEMPTVSATAARGKDGKLYLGLVNAHAHDAQTLSVDLGKPVQAARGQLLTADKMDSENEIGKPAQVVPKAFEAQAAMASSS